MGIITAEMANPMMTQNQVSPALYPKNGGRIKFPAPKKRENKAKAVTKVCLVGLIGGYLSAEYRKMIYHYHEVPIFYEVIGTGPVMVLLHGFLESSSMWKEIAPILSENHTIIYIDLPGHGKSEVIDTVHSMELMADVVYELLKHEKIEKAKLVGHSMGGYVALALLEKHSDIIEHLVLLNSTTYMDSDHRKQQRERALRFIEKEKDIVISMAISNLFSPEARITYTSEIEKLKEEALIFPIEGITAAIRGMKDRKDRTKLMRVFNKKKTLICGDKDPIVPLEISKAISKETHADLKILDGSHMSWIENKEEIVKILHLIE